MTCYKSKELNNPNVPDSWKRPIAQALQVTYVSAFCLFFFVIVGAISGLADPELILFSDAPLLDGINENFGTHTFFSGFSGFSMVVGALANMQAASILLNEQIVSFAEIGTSH